MESSEKSSGNAVFSPPRSRLLIGGKKGACANASYDAFCGALSTPAYSKAREFAATVFTLDQSPNMRRNFSSPTS